jgi:hypothetical protein
MTTRKPMSFFRCSLSHTGLLTPHFIAPDPNHHRDPTAMAHNRGSRGRLEAIEGTHSASKHLDAQYIDNVLRHHHNHTPSLERADPDAPSRCTIFIHPHSRLARRGAKFFSAHSPVAWASEPENRRSHCAMNRSRSTRPGLRKKRCFGICHNAMRILE